ncbi:MAG TPA: MBL fold metallo-hydrolase [Acidimicrobiales bacterium]|nr:MBL fold metallo-hydrolase [Acidimicrobiales bacterium]
MRIEGIPLWLAETNCWIVAPTGSGGECVIIDAPPDPATILSRLAEQELRLVALLSTHGHVDHVGGVAPVVRAQPEPVPVRIHDHDRHMLLDPVGTSGAFGRMLAAEGLDLRPPELVQGLDDGERVSGAGLTFTAIHTPGHTQGSTCFLLEVEGEAPILFSGDHLFAGSIGRTDLPGGSYDQLMDSMASKILPLSDDIQVLPGHGPTTTIGRERTTNPFIIELLYDRR